jgi:hypothetical protein
VTQVSFGWETAASVRTSKQSSSLRPPNEGPGGRGGSTSDRSNGSEIWPLGQRTIAAKVTGARLSLLSLFGMVPCVCFAAWCKAMEHDSPPQRRKRG